MREKFENVNVCRFSAIGIIKISNTDIFELESLSVGFQNYRYPIRLLLLKCKISELIRDYSHASGTFSMAQEGNRRDDRGKPRVGINVHSRWIGGNVLP